MIGYIFDEALRIELNRNNKNYWDIYIREINEQLGLCALPLSLKKLENDSSLKKVSVFCIGFQSLKKRPEFNLTVGAVDPLK